MSEHFALAFATHANEILHSNLSVTFDYRHEILEVPGLVTALFITYAGRRGDEYEIKTPVSFDEFKARLMEVKYEWHDLEEATIRGLAAKPEKSISGWENQTIYIVRGGSFPPSWTTALAEQWLSLILSGSALFWGPMIEQEWKYLDENIAAGQPGAAAFEHQVRVTMNFLFGNQQLLDGSHHSRTEDDGLEIRDIIYRNVATDGFWRDLRDKYGCSEIIFEVKNKQTINRDDLRQLYCYLKPATGLWGILVSRGDIPDPVAAYNRQLFRNFAQQRGVLIITTRDIKKMIAIKLRKLNAAEQLAALQSEFIRSV